MQLSLTSDSPHSDNVTDTWNCPVANGAYCAGDSLSTPVVILCNNGKGVPGNCIPHNWNRPPINVYYSPCYQSSSTAGDAACAKNCVVYPDSGLPFDVPGSCNATYFNSIDVTGGLISTSCKTVNGSAVCNDTMHGNATRSGSSNTSSAMSSGSSSLPTTTGTAGFGSATTTASAGAQTPTKGAASILAAAPVAGYAVLGLIALAI